MGYVSNFTIIFSATILLFLIAIIISEFYYCETCFVWKNLAKRPSHTAGSVTTNNWSTGIWLWDFQEEWFILPNVACLCSVLYNKSWFQNTWIVWFHIFLDFNAHPSLPCIVPFLHLITPCTCSIISVFSTNWTPVLLEVPGGGSWTTGRLAVLAISFLSFLYLA
jgi:hypothetical protein